MNADDLMREFMEQVKQTPWVTSFGLTLREGWLMEFRFSYCKLPNVYIDGPQEQFLSYASESLDRNSRGMGFIGGGGVVAHGREDWTGERVYLWYPEQQVSAWHGSKRTLLELPQHVMELLK